MTVDRAAPAWQTLGGLAPGGGAGARDTRACTPFCPADGGNGFLATRLEGRRGLERTKPGVPRACRLASVDRRRARPAQRSAGGIVAGAA